MNTPNQVFLDLFNELDFILRQKLGKESGVSHSTLLSLYGEQDSYFKKFESSLHVYKNLRNVLVHGSLPGQKLPIAIPEKRVVDDYEKIIEHLKNPKTALETIAIRKVYSVSWDQPVLSHLEYMDSKGYRLAPILSSSCIVGVFTESTLIKSFILSGGLTLGTETTFAEFEDLCSFKKGVQLEGVEFLNESASVQEVEAVFQKNFEANKLTSVVCITHAGIPNSELLGIVTAHDLPSASGFNNMGL